MPYVELYLNEARPALLSSDHSDALWISSLTGQQMSAHDIGKLISTLTLQTLGVAVLTPPLPDIGRHHRIGGFPQGATSCQRST